MRISQVCHDFAWQWYFFMSDYTQRHGRWCFIILFCGVQRNNNELFTWEEWILCTALIKCWFGWNNRNFKSFKCIRETTSSHYFSGSQPLSWRSPTLHVFHGCIRNHPLYPHSLFLTLVHSYSSLEGVNENEWVNSDTECTGRTTAFA